MGMMCLWKLSGNKTDKHKIVELKHCYKHAILLDNLTWFTLNVASTRPMDSKFCECSITDKPQPCAMLEQKIMFCHFSLCAMLTVYQLNKLV